MKASDVERPEASSVRSVLAREAAGGEVTLRGWVRTARHSKGVSFLELNDGSCFSGIQVVADPKLDDFESTIRHLQTGCAIEARGELVFFSDADLQFDLREIADLLAHADDVEIVAGYRAPRRDPWIRRALARTWGGLVGLRLLAENPDRFDRIIVGNTGLPTGHGMSEAFDQWRTFSQTVDVLPIGMILQGATTTELSDAVVAAYEAPYPDESYKAGARIWPALVPVEPDDPAVAANLAAWDVLRGWTKPLLTTFSDQDPVTGGGHRIFEREVPGAQGQPHVIIEGGGHFLQEDCGPLIAQTMVDWMAD